MTDGLTTIITQLEQRKTAIERALAALREVGGVSGPAPVTPASTATAEPTGRKGKKRSAAVRRRMQEAQRARWATIKGKLETPAPVTKEAPKRQISAEGMKRIIAATKKRWRLKRAADKAAQEQAEAKKVASQIARKKAAAPVKAAKTKAAVANAAPATVPAPATLAAAAEQV